MSSPENHFPINSFAASPCCLPASYNVVAVMLNRGGWYLADAGEHRSTTRNSAVVREPRNTLVFIISEGSRIRVRECTRFEKVRAQHKLLPRENREVNPQSNRSRVSIQSRSLETTSLASKVNALDRWAYGNDEHTDVTLQVNRTMRQKNRCTV